MNALLQKDYLMGKDIWMNPPFLLMKDFIKLANDLFSADKRTRVILVAPERPKQNWWNDIWLNKDW